MVQSSWQLSADEARAQMRANLQERRVQIMDTRVPQRFGQVAEGMWQGYHAAIADEEPVALVARLAEIENELLGFALEGVGMGLAELDAFKPKPQSRVQAFLKNNGAAYQTMVYLGVGLILVRRKLPIEPYLAELDPVKSLPVIDGYAFNHGIFYWRNYINGHRVPQELSGYDRHVFDQGLGRSIWLLDGADATRISKTIGAFPSTRQVDLWGGVGYACASIGGAGQAMLETLGMAAGSRIVELAKGATCAAKFRQMLGNAEGYTELAREVLCTLAAGIETASEEHNEARSEQLDWQHYRETLSRNLE